MEEDANEPDIDEEDDEDEEEEDDEDNDDDDNDDEDNDDNDDDNAANGNLSSQPTGDADSNRDMDTNKEPPATGKRDANPSGSNDSHQSHDELVNSKKTCEAAGSKRTVQVRSKKVITSSRYRFTTVSSTIEHKSYYTNPKKTAQSMPKKLDSKKTNPVGGDAASIASSATKKAAARIVEKAKSDTLAKNAKSSSITSSASANDMKKLVKPGTSKSSMEPPAQRKYVVNKKPAMPQARAAPVVSKAITTSVSVTISKEFNLRKLDKKPASIVASSSSGVRAVKQQPGQSKKSNEQKDEADNSNYEQSNLEHFTSLIESKITEVATNESKCTPEFNMINPGASCFTSLGCLAPSHNKTSKLYKMEKPYLLNCHKKLIRNLQGEAATVVTRDEEIFRINSVDFKDLRLKSKLLNQELKSSEHEANSDNTQNVTTDLSESTSHEYLDEMGSKSISFMSIHSYDTSKNNDTISFLSQSNIDAELSKQKCFEAESILLKQESRRKSFAGRDQNSLLAKDELMDSVEFTYN